MYGPKVIILAFLILITGFFCFSIPSRRIRLISKVRYKSDSTQLATLMGSLGNTVIHIVLVRSQRIDRPNVCLISCLAFCQGLINECVLGEGQNEAFLGLNIVIGLHELTAPALFRICPANKSPGRCISQPSCMFYKSYAAVVI